MSALWPTTGTLALAIALGAWLAFHELSTPPSVPSTRPDEATRIVPREIVLPVPPPTVTVWPPGQSATRVSPSLTPPPSAAATQGSASGRVLLRQLEHGQGPAIDIAWPARAEDRQKLHERLTRCHGMRLAIMDREGRLFDAESAAGRPWEINLDRYSGFVRQGDGPLVAGDAAAGVAIRARHGLTAETVTVTVFPRSVDAALLAGLAPIAGYDYDSAKTVRAAYALAGRRVAVEGIWVDGFQFDGAIVLPTVASGCG